MTKQTRFKATVALMPGKTRSQPVILDLQDRRYVTFITSKYNAELAEDFYLNPGLVGTYDWRDLPEEWTENGTSGG